MKSENDLSQFKNKQRQCSLKPYLEQINIKNKFKSNNSIEIQSVTSQLKSSPPSTSELNNQHGIKQHNRLKQLVDNFDQYGEVIRLAYLGSNQEVHIDEETLYFLQKYSTFQIAFVAFVGEKNAGKSFILDTVLNLSCTEGNQFTSLVGDSQEKGIYLWTIPFSSNFRRKIFLIQCSGISFQSAGLIREDEILLDLVNILSSTMVVVHPNNNHQKIKKKIHIFQKEQQPSGTELNLIQELKKSTQRILNDDKKTSKLDTFWPQNVYSLYNSKIPVGTVNLYQEIYKDCSTFQLSQAFLQDNPTQNECVQALNNKLSGVGHMFITKISQIFQQIVNRTSSKEYSNLKYTGNICCKLLINSIKYLNKKSKIKINKIFTSILKELYQSSYTYHTQLYDDYLQEHFSSQQPLSLDGLIEVFRITSTYVINSFNQTIIEEVHHKQYEDKLVNYIENKEGLIIQINSKKTKNALKEKIKKIENVDICDLQSIKDFLFNLNKMQQKLDHNKTYIIAENILKYTRNIEKRMIEQQEKKQKETISRLKQQTESLKIHYIQIKKKNQQNLKENLKNEKQFRQLTRQQTNATNNLRTLKKEIEAQKRYQKQYIVSKQSKKQYAESLLDIVRQLEQKIRDNKRIMDQICKQYEYHPDILALQKKIEEKEREIKGLQKIQSKIDLQSKNSMISKNSALKSNVSIMRSAVQKPRQPKQQQQQQPKTIKKLTKK